MTENICSCYKVTV